MESLERAGDESIEDVFLQDHLRPTIAEHATHCQSLFHKYMVMPEIVPDPTIMDGQRAYFSIWASDMDVYGPRTISLDYRLRFSPTAVDEIHQLLDVVCDTLLSLKPIEDRPPQTSSRKRQRMSVHGNSGVTRRADDDASDSESDVNPAEENFLKITQTIGRTLKRLYRLSRAVRLSAKADRARKIERHHVIEDLEPFICVLPHCLEGGHHGHGTSPLTFETSEAWSSHMQTAHGYTWECRAPSHDLIVFDQEIQYQEHSIKEHGVPEAHVRTLSNAMRRPVVDKVLECPFGDDFQPSGKVESNAVFSSEALQSHVACHMMEIALLTLQKLPSDDDEKVENVDSDHPLEDDEPAVAFRN
ncbi:hypothetical protein LTR96_003019 [Exophiala xenobiotica]|nr:hypothetical protein LTR72_000938 [Exophiala xenobiotica]KAK5271195.1 hypothetical protein LTR96_003019 [Exophiala xenobiotica]KAK5289681.1 hypothetical protein LTR14_007319 [Exophiala xenobiotica]KAK5342430.1 hypothetical protein LTR98_000055 [Exophiala xenobiotica]KAK5440224.1 hypothetical protein LTR18_008161 [Exophiala xenobiotica]